MRGGSKDEREDRGDRILYVIVKAKALQHTGGNCFFVEGMLQHPL